MTRICAWCQTGMPSREEDLGLVTHGICETCANALLSDSPVSLHSYLDSLSVPVLLVDSDVTSSFANREALKIIGKPLNWITGRKGGDVFVCAHAQSPEGCGKTIHCSGCAIRNSVMLTHETGEPQVMVPATLERGDLHGPASIALVITTVKQGDLVLLVINRVA